MSAVRLHRLIIYYTQQTDVLTEYKKENNFNNNYI